MPNKRCATRVWMLCSTRRAFRPLSQMDPGLRSAASGWLGIEGSISIRRLSRNGQQGGARAGTLMTRGVGMSRATRRRAAPIE
jgi:hypothetical protein